jgi:hypothetical protein
VALAGKWIVLSNGYSIQLGDIDRATAASRKMDVNGLVGCFDGRQVGANARPRHRHHSPPLSALTRPLGGSFRLTTTTSRAAKDVMVLEDAPEAFSLSLGDLGLAKARAGKPEAATQSSARS